MGDDADRRVERYLEHSTGNEGDRFAAIMFMASVFVPPLVVHLIANILVWVGWAHTT